MSQFQGVPGVSTDVFNTSIDGLNIRISPIIKYKSVLIGSVTIGASGYLDIISYRPSNPTGYSLMLATVDTYGQNSAKDSFTTTADGHYLVGTAGATITNVSVCYYFITSTCIGTF